MIFWNEFEAKVKLEGGGEDRSLDGGDRDRTEYYWSLLNVVAVGTYETF